MNVLL